MASRQVASALLQHATGLLASSCSCTAFTAAPPLLVALGQHRHLASAAAQAASSSSSSATPKVAASKSKTSQGGNDSQLPAHIKAKKAWQASNKVVNKKRLRLEAKQHPVYMAIQRAKSEYKKAVFQRVLQWRAELNERKMKEEKEQHARLKAEAVQVEQDKEVELKSQLEKLREELQKAELDYEVAKLRLAKAKKSEEEQEQLKAAEELRFKTLLASSRTWITKEQFADRINFVLDNPEPFGFVVTRPAEQGQ